MIRRLLTAALFPALMALPGPAAAAGCLKGAAVGGVGGHFVGRGHALAGAAIGCAVGHHRAAAAARRDGAARGRR